MQKSDYSLRFQIFIVILCVPLNVLVSRLANIANFPFFMDTAFTACAAFFNLWCGLATGFFTQLILVIFFDNTPAAFLFVICNMSVALAVYIAFRKSIRPKIAELVLASVLASLIVAIEGGIIHSILYTLVNYEDLSITKFIMLALLNQNFSFTISAMLGRIPGSLIDKSISVFAGFLFFVIIDKLYKKTTKKKLLR